MSLWSGGRPEHTYIEFVEVDVNRTAVHSKGGPYDSDNLSSEYYRVGCAMFAQKAYIINTKVEDFCKSLDKFSHGDILARPIEISSIRQHVQAWTRGSPIFSILRAVHIVFIVIDRLVDGERLFARDRMLGRWSEGVTAHGLRASQFGQAMHSRA